MVFGFSHLDDRSSFFEIRICQSFVQRLSAQSLRPASQPSQQERPPPSHRSADGDACAVFDVPNMRRGPEGLHARRHGRVVCLDVSHLRISTRMTAFSASPCVESILLQTEARAVAPAQQANCPNPLVGVGGDACGFSFATFSLIFLRGTSSLFPSCRCH